jgi:hypothetical protein
MKFPTSDVTLDFLKYALTAGVSFGASLLYTNCALQPANNVTLLPLSITLPKSNVVCDVSQENLKAAIQRVKDTNSPVGPALLDSYESYLPLLSTSPEVLKEQIPPSFLANLERDKILTCEREIDIGAAASLESAALLDQPTRYLMRRSCWVIYEDVAIPIRASAQKRSTEYGAVEPDTLLIDDTAPMTFSFDQSGKSDLLIQGKFKKLMQELHDRERVFLGIKCQVIAADSEVSIGGRAYPVPSIRPSE